MHTCPNCQSDNIHPFRMAYESGTTIKTGYLVGTGATLASWQSGLWVGAATPLTLT